MGQPNIHHVMPVSKDGTIVYAGGPVENWQPDEAYDEIERVTIRANGVEVTGTGPARVEKGARSWALAVQADREIQGERAEVEAVSRTYGQDGKPSEPYKWSEEVALIREPSVGS